MWWCWWWGGVGVAGDRSLDTGVAVGGAGPGTETDTTLVAPVV